MLGTDERLQHALELAYRHLNRRDRTEAELRPHLAQHGVEAPIIEHAIRTLVDQGYLDDARFVLLFTQDKRELEHWGNDRIRRTLLDRGLDSELIDETLSAQAPGSELDRALELLARRFPTPPQDRRERDRALGMMLRKGYESEVALDALATYARDAAQPGLR